MKITREIVAITVLVLMQSITHAQERAETYGEQVAAMAKLKPLVGEWTGEGWIQMGSRRFEFESSENITEMAGGLAMVIQGLHHIVLPNGQKREVHNAVALIKFDPESNRYRFITQLANGRAGDYWGSVTDDGKFQWTIDDAPARKMTYTISVSGDSYDEIGELATDSGARQFFEMKLKRTGN